MAKRFLLIPALAFLMSFSLTWADENLLFSVKTGFSPQKISWAHLPDFYSQPRGESVIDFDGDNTADLLVFLPEYPADRIKAFLSDGSFAWEYNVDRSDQPIREFGAFALAAFDVDADGIKEVICGTNDLRLYALDAATGEIKRQVQLDYGCYVCSMTVADVTGDGSPELIVACAGNAEWQRGYMRILPLSRGYIYALDSDLEPVWHEPVGHEGILFAHYVFAGDLDGDGGEEVMIPDLSGSFHLLDDSGTVLWDKSIKEINPKETPSHIDYAMIADMDGNPESGNELVIAAEGSGCCMYNRDGRILWRTDGDVSHGQHCAACDVRIDKKGKEILFFDKVGERILLFTSYGEKLWEQKVGYTIVMGGFINWTADGTEEIIAAAGEYVLIYDEYGRLMERMDAPSLLNHDGMVADLAGDQREEYIAVAEDEFFVFSNPHPPASEDPMAGLEADQKTAYISTLESNPAKSSILLQNFPNPFATGTYIPYVSRRKNGIEINIYDIGGALLRTLEIGTEIELGSVYWDGRNEMGEDVPYGVYFCSIAGEDSVRKMVKMVD